MFMKTEQICNRAETSPRMTILSRRGTRIDPADLRERIKAIERLRNNLAHANAYADSVAKAKKVCAVLRDIYDLKKAILAVVQGPPR